MDDRETARLMLAAAALQGLLAGEVLVPDEMSEDEAAAFVARAALRCADALLAELAKSPPPDRTKETPRPPTDPGESGAGEHSSYAGGMVPGGASRTCHTSTQGNESGITATTCASSTETIPSIGENKRRERPLGEQSPAADSREVPASNAAPGTPSHTTTTTTSPSSCDGSAGRITKSSTADRAATDNVAGSIPAPATSLWDCEVDRYRGDPPCPGPIVYDPESKARLCAVHMAAVPSVRAEWHRRNKHRNAPAPPVARVG